MSPILSGILIVAAVVLVIFITILIRQNKMPICYSVLWYAFALLMLLGGVVPDFVGAIAHLFGFQVMSNFVIGIIVGVLILLNIILTTMIASQRKRTQLLSQELVLIKKELKDVQKTKK